MLDPKEWFELPVFIIGETARTAIVCSPGKLQSIVEGYARYTSHFYYPKFRHTEGGH